MSYMILGKCERNLYFFWKVRSFNQKKKCIYIYMHANVTTTEIWSNIMRIVVAQFNGPTAHANKSLKTIVFLNI